ncbi:probable H/ACA ribonucleoprotein complex subunit 1-like protein isoform X4 [Sinocyclocheilus rhinocerous]|uniref:probable H/ACA ribonucleoprotein complex subunit 1-like protein isoform X4 n=1 Tax=Sinocyclocheilus rhinocerous TaxID=307959 RepID=UPI0007B93AEC|nr:PREDICTED: probable H/ACA ribonucleoprotein complex subunit 1-like protein isoform X4 [Sinocyclocheilus rhinocerous]
MGENDVQMESTEQMQEPHASCSDKIDLSLDDIIKLNKKEQKANRAANRAKTKRAVNRNNVLKKLNQVPQQQRGLRRGAQQYQGPGRVRGLRRQRGSGRGMMSRRDSLNRAAAAATTGEQFDQTTFTSRGTFRGRGRGRGRGGGLSSRGALSARGQRGGRPFVLDRGFSATKRAEKLQKYQTIRSRRTAPSGSTLTVSLPNAKSAPVAVKTSNQTRRGGAVLRGRSSRGAGTSSSMGIPLQFNYKATTNQTAVYLNDRFTDLRLRGQGRGRERGDGRGRGAVGGGGRGGGRGNIVGGGRGRGQGNIGGGRGRGRGNFMGGGRGRGRGNFMGDGRGRGNIMGGGRGRGRGGVGVARGGRGLRRGSGGSRGADRTVTLQ